MNSAPEEHQLGEYRLKQLLAENAVFKTWLAEQISVSRLVLVDEFQADPFAEKDAFLADIRAKASVDHPLVGSVYEAVAEPNCCFYAYELLPGLTLKAREKAQQPFPAAALAHLLRRVSEGHLHHETLGHATSPLELDAIHVDQHGVIRLKNLAIAGLRTPDQSVRDIVHLGVALIPLVAAEQSGATRMFTLFSWMRGEGLEAPITWAQTRDYCLQIEQQLADPLSSLAVTRATAQTSKREALAIITSATVLILIGIIGIAVKMRSMVPPAPPRPSLPNAVTVAAGKYLMPDGMEETLPAFRISANEVTIGQYAEFLETLATLAKDGREHTFDFSGQTLEKTSHQPDDWPALAAAAKANGLWNKQSVSLDSPIIGVDWWDAAAYAEWKKAHLPSQEEWFAALNLEVESPATIEPGPWAPVTSQVSDHTPSGLIGMAGSVCEWTSKPATNPANPLGERLSVIIGGSYLKPGSNALTREWTASRLLRRPDLGFRLVFDPE